MTSDIEKMISVANCLALISCRDREIFFDNVKINIRIYTSDFNEKMEMNEKQTYILFSF